MIEAAHPPFMNSCGFIGASGFNASGTLYGCVRIVRPDRMIKMTLIVTSTIPLAGVQKKTVNAVADTSYKDHLLHGKVKFKA
jgi:hypothetical protein